MDRRRFLKESSLALLLPLSRNPSSAGKTFRRRRPSDPDWPSETAWKRLNDEVDGNLMRVEFPLEACIKEADGVACRSLIANIKNPYYMGCCDVVSNAVAPGSQGAAAVVLIKTPPQLKMDILAQVAALFRVGFVGGRKPFESGAPSFYGGFVKFIRTRSYRRDRLASFHTQASRWGWKFLTNLQKKSAGSFSAAGVADQRSLV